MPFLRRENQNLKGNRRLVMNLKRILIVDAGVMRYGISLVVARSSFGYRIYETFIHLRMEYKR